MSDLAVGAALSHSGTVPAAGGWRALAGKIRIPAIETYAPAQAFAKTVFGKLALAVLLGLALLPTSKSWPLLIAISAAVFLCSVAGRYRPYGLTLTSLAVLIAAPGWFETVPDLTIARTGAKIADGTTLTLALIIVFGASAILLAAAPRLRDTTALRHPVLSLFGLYGALVAATIAPPWSADASALLWALIVVFGAYFWFLCYGLIDAKRGAAPAFVQLGTFRTAWSWSEVPFAKGAGYLRKLEATTADDLAITQLKGIKLLLWACVLKVTLIGFNALAHRVGGLPSLQAALASQISGAAMSVTICWLCLLATFIETLLTMAVFGHLMVAVGRLCGYRLLRNTYRPLTSRTLAEFWNRYYFYFKELLVDLFFYPTFLRCFRKQPRLRLAFATVMAAGVGNALYHFMREIGAVREIGIAHAVIGYQTYAFYCLVLAGGIAVSQLRKPKPAATATVFERLRASLGVLTFFCLLQVFDDLGRDTTLADHVVFFFRLFGIDMTGS